jgi:lipopolysaccharide export system protein LptA
MSAPAQRLRRGAVAAAALALAMTVCGVAQSAPKNQAPQNQGPPNALQGFSQNRDQPIKIQAASLEVREKDKLATFTGDVHVVNGDTEMRCKSLQVFYDQEPGGGAAKEPAGGLAKAADAGPAGAQQIRRIEAKGSVTVVQKDQHATGDSAIFNMRENTVTLNGNVIVTRGQDVLRGQRLVVNLTDGVSKMDGGRVDVLIDVRKSPEKK